MMTALVRLVFIFSLLVASIAHANAAPNILAQDLQDRAASSLSTDGENCNKSKAILSTTDFASCMLEASNNRTAPRCQVDLAPVLPAPLVTGDACGFVQHDFNHLAPTDWQSQPILGPPKLA
ncbi:hypothetical protein N9V95_00400 [bacterium]|nr:hypothetical protein [bacterium]